MIRAPAIAPSGVLIVLLMAALCLPALRAYTITISPGEAAGTGTGTPRDKGRPSPVGILIIGDSLSFGPFGKQLESRLRKRFGNSEIALYASCGSSPENWLGSTPVFVTRCGYREDLPGEPAVLVDALDGKPCPPWKTPKIPAILKRWSPAFVVVQQGTNWMDNMPDPVKSDGDKARRIIRNFISELRGGNSSRQIIWILPPESSKYAAPTKRAVDAWITRALQEAGCTPIRSRNLTGPYKKGVTGTDGVHYSKPAAESWANKVYGRLINALPESPLPQPSAFLSPGLSTNLPPR